MTNHISHQNTGLKRVSIKLDRSDKSTPDLPDSYVIHEPVEHSQINIFAPKLGILILRPKNNTSDAENKDEAWFAQYFAESDIITW